jgi:hypothetical protein
MANAAIRSSTGTVQILNLFFFTAFILLMEFWHFRHGQEDLFCGAEDALVQGMGKGRDSQSGTIPDSMNSHPM